MGDAIERPMNRESIRERGDFESNWVSVWVIGLFSLALWMAFTPYLAMEQARQLAVCLAGLCGLTIFSFIERARKKWAQGKELHWNGFHGSAA